MGDFDSDKGAKKVVFVTVETTYFDALVRTVDTPRIKEELYRKGYTYLVIQMGCGSYIPSKVFISLMTYGEVGPLAVDHFTFSPIIAEYLRSASLVISHADLMDNHQCELAEELADWRHLLYARPKTLMETMDLESLVPHPPADATSAAKLINMFLGFSDE